MSLFGAYLDPWGLLGIAGGFIIILLWVLHDTAKQTEMVRRSNPWSDD